MKSTSQDHFNWPFPQRNETIANSGNSKFFIAINTFTDLQDLTGSLIKTQNIRQRATTSLLTSDIPKAQPYLPGYKYLNKPSFINQCSDININDPSRLAKSSFLLKVDDIDGASPNMIKFKSNRDTNPLNPVYTLPKVVEAPQLPQRFIKDSLDVSDIKGTNSRDYYERLRNRAIIVKENILGSSSTQKFIPRDQISSLDVKDINNDGIRNFIRGTNPLDPRYNIKTDGKYSELYGEIKDSKPAIRHPEIKKQLLDQSLHTKDIQGAWSNSLKERTLFLNNRKNFIATNKTEDIPGAQTGSLTKGIKTKRISNPLQPVYQNPGTSEAYGFQDRNSMGNINSQVKPNNKLDRDQRSYSISETRVQKLDKYLK